MVASENSEKIVITSEDTNAPRAHSVSEQMKQAETYATIRDVGDASTAAKGGITLIAIGIMVAAGIVGGFFAFALNKLSDVVINWDNQESWVGNLTFTFLMAFAIGLTILIGDSASERNLSKLGMSVAIGIPVALISGLAVGGIAHLIYSPWVTSIYESAQAQVNLGVITNENQWSDYITARLHWARGVAWSIVGLAAGLTIGIASRSLRRILVTAAGGFIGGFLGGFVFDFFTGESSAQVVGMVITGLLIGLSMALLEQASKTRWIEIVSGGMAGKQFILYKTDLTIGSSPRADITLIKDPAIPELAARLTIKGNQAVLESINPSLPVAVNKQVAMRAVLTDGAELTFGKSIVRYREKNSEQSAPVGGPVRLS